MMALSDEEYKRLDAAYSDRRKFFDSKREQYPLLEDVIQGDDSFTRHALDLDKWFLRQTSKFFINSREALEYVDEIKSFSAMMEGLCSARIPPDTTALIFVIVTRLKTIRDTDWPAINGVFDMLWACSKLLDRNVRKLYAPTLFQKNPRLFREVYADMSLEERAYTEARLYRMLDAGIFSGKAGIDEIALKQGLAEPELRRQFDRYIDNMVASALGGKVKDPATMRYVEPDESFMRSIEERLEPPLTPQMREERVEFRTLLAEDVTLQETEGKTFDYASNEPIRRAIERKIKNIPALRDKR